MADTNSPSERLLGIPAFRWLWCAHLVSQLGDGLYTVTLPWLTWQHLHSSFATAGTLAATSFSYFVVGPIAGVYVDRWDRRSTLIGADLLRAAALATLPLVLLWHFNLGAVLALAVLLPAISRFFTPAQRAAVPQLVSRDRLVAANAQVQGAGDAAFIAGPALAGLLLPVIGGVSLLFVDGLTFIVSAAFLSLIAFPRRNASIQGHRRFWDEFVHGFRLTWRIPGLRALALLGVGATICFAPVPSLLPVWLGRSGADSSRAYGLLTSSVFVGSLAGSLAMNRWGSRVGRGTVVTTSVLVLGLAIASFGSAHQVMVGALSLAVLGACLSAYTVGVMTLLQQLAPADSMGRAIAVNETITWSLRFAAILIVGAIVGIGGVHQTLVGLGVGMLVMGTAALLTPALRGHQVAAL